MVAINLKERFRNGELDLSSCGLKEIPKDINTLKHITSLNLSNNKIASVGKIIGNLTHLTKLSLSKNQVKGLPENVGNLVNLKYLDLSYNQIATLPITIGNLKNLKHLDLKNNPLAQKFSEIVGTSCQNESQCQQAAKNVLKAFASNADGDKKKKQNQEKDSKKNKSDKKTQNGGINQPKQKDRKLKKSSKSIFGKITELIFFILRTLFYSLLVVGIGVYILSFYDETRYKTIKKRLYPYWHSAVSRVLTAEQTVQLEARLLMAGSHMNQTIVDGSKVVVLKSKQLYEYVTTDENIQKYVNATKTTVFELWEKTRSLLGGSEQKQKS